MPAMAAVEAVAGLPAAPPRHVPLPVGAAGPLSRGVEAVEAAAPERLEGKGALQPPPDHVAPCVEPFRGDRYPAADPDPQYDVTHYELDIELEPQARRLRGRVRIELTLLRPTSETIELKFCGPRIDGIWDDTTPLSWERDDAALRVRTGPRPAGATLRLWVDYAGYVGGASQDRGIHWPRPYNPPSPALFTFSEAEWARWWYPGNDVPWDKATADIIVTVPGDQVVASNGVLLSDVRLTDGRRRFHWRETHPIATYLIVIHSGPYAIVRDDRLPGLPLRHYVYPGDSLLAVATFDSLPVMIRHFESLFGPYPFSGYGHAEAPFPGGMEHQGMTTLADFAVRGGSEYQWLIAHELAHHWWGDSVTLRDWRHIWLNEGFASYADVLWAEHQSGTAGRRARLDLFASLVGLEYSRGFGTTVLDPLATRLFSATTYDKGAWVLHMLRGLLGEGAFFALLRDYHATHRHGVADTDDFIRIAERHAGRPLRWFFDPWLTAVGYPVYAIDWRSEAGAGGGARLTLTLEQQQSEVVYRMPIDVEVRTTAGTERHRIDSDRRRHSAVLELGAPVAAGEDAVRLDPDGWLLHAAYRTPLDPVAEAGDAVTAAPAPGAPSATPELEVTLNGSAPVAGTVRLFDLAGRRVTDLYSGYLVPGTTRLRWDGRTGNGAAAPSGLYWARVSIGHARASARLLLVR